MLICMSGFLVGKFVVQRLGHSVLSRRFLAKEASEGGQQGVKMISPVTIPGDLFIEGCQFINTVQLLDDYVIIRH